MLKREHLKVGLTLILSNSCRLYYVNIADDELVVCVRVKELNCKLFDCFFHILLYLFIRSLHVALVPVMLLMK